MDRAEAALRPPTCLIFVDPTAVSFAGQAKPYRVEACTAGSFSGQSPEMRRAALSGRRPRPLRRAGSGPHRLRSP